MAKVLGIDLSTQSCSGVLLDTELGTILSEESISFGQDLPHYNSPQGFLTHGSIPGEVHSDPCMWVEALEMLFSRWAKKGISFSEIEAVSGAGQQHGTVYLNSHWGEFSSNPDTESSLHSQIEKCLSRRTSPIWMDSSTSKECEEIADTVGGNKEVCARSGSIAIERFSGPQIRRFSKTEPEAYGNTSRIHLVSSFLASLLAGEDAPIDYGDGAGMNLLNMNTWQWDEGLVDATAPDLLGKLPAVVPSATRIGTIAAFWQKKYGFSAGVPVIACTGDNPSSLIGMGASQPGKVVISLGTSDTFFAAMPGVRTDPLGYGHVFGNPAGGAMTLQCFRNGSLAREKVRNELEWDWQRFDDAIIKHTTPGNDGRWMLPFFEPEITPKTNSHAPIFGGAGKIDPHTECDVYARACVEGQMLNLWKHSAWMKLDTKEILLTGGGSRSQGIARIAADVFQATVKRLSVTGSVGLGAALRAAVTGLNVDLASLEAKFCQPDEQGQVEPDPHCTKLYKDMAQTLKV